MVEKLFTKVLSDEDRERCINLRARGFIAHLSDFLFNHTWSAQEICDIAALQTIDTVIPNAWINTDIGDLHLHVWAIVIDETGSGKSVPYNYHINPIFRTMEKYLNLEFMLDAKGSVEAVTSLLHERMEKEVEKDEDGNEFISPNWHPPCGLKEGDYLRFGGFQHADEITDEWSSLNNPGSYQYKFNAFNIKVFDGYIEAKNTRVAGRENYRPVYVVRVGMTQPINAFMMFKDKNFKLKYYSSGQGPRYVYIYRPKNRKEEPRGEVSKLDMDAMRENFAQKLCCLYKYNVKEITKPDIIADYLKGLCIDLANDIDELRTPEIKEDYDVGYLRRQKVILYRLSAIHCISRHMDEIINEVEKIDRITSVNENTGEEVVTFGDYFCEDGHTLELNFEDVNWAVGRVLFYYENFKRMMEEDKNFNPNTVPVTNLSGHVEKMQYVISRAKKGVIAENDLQGKLAWKPKDYTDVVSLMRKSGLLFVLDTDKINPTTRKKYNLPATGNKVRLLSLQEFPENEVP